MKKTIFISYAWEDIEETDIKIKRFVKWMAVYLKKWDFDVLLDVYENHPGTKLDNYMSEGINSSRFVLCICTKTYLKKMTIPNTGVNNEIKLLESMANKPFIIPIIEKDGFENLPKFFEGKFISQLLFDTPYSQYNKNELFNLIMTLRDENISIKDISAESRIENYYNDVEKIKFKSDVINLMNFEVQTEQIVTFQYLLNDGDFKIGIPPMEFTTHWSTSGYDSIYTYNKEESMDVINNFHSFSKITRPSDIDENLLTPIKWGASLKIGDGIVWINQNNYMAIGKIIEISLNKESESQSTVKLQYRVLNPIDLTDSFVELSKIN